MAKTIRAYSVEITVAAGSGSVQITDDEFRPISDAGGYIAQILVQAPSPDTPDTFVTFDIEIVDSDGFIVYDKIGSEDHINDTTRIPVKGDYDINIDKATKDGTYKLKLIHEEEW